MSKDSKSSKLEKILTIALIIILCVGLTVAVVWFLQKKQAQKQAAQNTGNTETTENSGVSTRDVQTGEIFSQLQDKKYESFSTRMGTLAEENEQNKSLVEWRDEEITELRARLTALNQDLATQFENAELLRKEKDELTMELADTQKMLAAAQALATGDGSAQNELLTAANQEKEALQKEKDALQAELTETQKQLADTRKQVAELQTAVEELRAQAEAAIQALADAQASGSQDTADQSELLDKTIQEKETLEKDKESLQQERDALQADLTAEKDKLAAMETRLADARKQADDLQSAMVELQAQTEAAKQALADMQSSAEADKTAQDELLNKANQEKKNLQKEKEALQAELEAEQDKLTAAEKALAESQKQAAALQSAAADLKGQVDKANQALAAMQSSTDADKSAQDVLLKLAVQEKETLQKEKETLQAELETEKDKLAAAEKALADSRKQVTALRSEAAEMEAQTKAAKQALADIQSSMETDKAAQDELLNKANQEKETLQKVKDALQADLDAEKEKLATAEKALADVQSQMTALRSSANADQTALNGLLTAADQEKETLQKEKDALQADLDAEKDKLTAAEKALADVQSQVTALRSEAAEWKAQTEETAQALADAAQEKDQLQAQLQTAQEELKSGADSVQTAHAELESARQEQAALQERLNQALSANQALTGQVEELERQSGSQGQEKKENAALRILLAKLLAAAYNGQTEFFSQEGMTSGAVLYENIGLERKAAQAAGIEQETPDGEEQTPAVTVNGEAITAEQADEAMRFVAVSRELIAELLPQEADQERSPRQILQNMAENLALWQKAEAAGLTLLSDRELEDLNAAAQRVSVLYGVPAESLLPELSANLVMNKLRDWAAQGVELSEAEYNQELRARVSANNALFQSSPDKFAKSLETEGFVSYIMPAEYRFVKHIYLPVEIGAYEELNGDIALAKRKVADLEYETALAIQASNPDEARLKREKKQEWENKLAEYEAQMEELEARVNQQYMDAQSAMADIKAQISNGTADADALIAQYSADADMPAKGYAICDGCTHPFREFVKAALRIPKKGQWSSFQELNDGYHILYYSETLTKDDVQAAKDQLREDMLAAIRQETVSTSFESWIAQADIHFSAAVSGE